MRTGGTLVALVLMASCDTGISQNATSAPDVSASQTEGGPDAPEAAGGADAASMEATVTWIPLDEGPADSGPGVGFDATDLNAPGPDPAPVGCGADAAEAGFCSMPYSACADHRWLVFYDNAQCVSGSCTWVKKYVDCGSIGCSGGWCHVPFTA
jgi:hypothetical protein